MKHYIVVSPEYETYLGSEVEPPEYGCDVAYVANASSAQEAKWAAVRLWEKHGRARNWPQQARLDSRHPLTGVKANRQIVPLGADQFGKFYVDLQEVPA